MNGRATMHGVFKAFFFIAVKMSSKTVRMDVSDLPGDMPYVTDQQKQPSNEDIKEIHRQTTEITSDEEAAKCVRDIFEMLQSCSGEAKYFKPLLKTISVLEKKANDKVLSQLRCYVPSDKGEEYII